MAVAAVADHVDDDVLAERLAEVGRQLGDVDDRLGVLAVDVEDRHLDHLGHVGAVPGRAGLGGRGGEADLVVDHDVDRAAGPVAGKLREVQRLGHQALAGERGVAVDQDRHAQLAVLVLMPPLLGPHPALDDRVDRLQVAGVGRQRQVDGALVLGDVVGREAEVVLDVAVAGDRLGHVPLELAEDQAVGLVQDVGQHVEPAPVGHPHDDLEDAVSSRPLDDRVEQRDQHLAPFEREPLLAHVVLVQEGLEQLGGVQLVDDPPLLLEVEARVVADRLHPVEQPVADVEVADVHELDADRPAVGLAEDAQQLAKGAVVVRAKLAVEDLVQVGLGEAKGGKLELLVRFRPRRQLERVEVGQVVAHLAVGVDQPRDRLDRLLHGAGAPSSTAVCPWND